MYYISKPRSSFFRAFDFTDHLENTALELQNSPYPRHNIKNESHRAIIDVVVPGYQKADLEIEITDKTLIVKSNCKKSTQKKDNCCGSFDDHQDDYCRDFSKTFELSNAIDPSTIKASLQDGILSIELGKKESAQPQSIAID